MSEIYQKLENCVRAVRERTDFLPETALVLGSGLGGFARQIQVEAEIPYEEIPGFPVSTVAGHAGKFLFGYAGGVPVAAMAGRVHYYEGYSMREAVTPVRVLKLLGAKKLILTNAAGGINLDFHPGDLMLLEDQISTFVPSPLIGENPEELGPRFPDMSRIYDPQLNAAVLEAARELGLELKRGVYLQCGGPNYESPAEIRMFRALGADAVGMSTACEAIAARHMGMRVCGISCITNMASGILPQPLDHAEVQKAASMVEERFEKLVLAALARFPA